MSDADRECAVFARLTRVARTAAGARCSTPKLRSLQKLLNATQSIGRLCNVCEDEMEMERDEWRLLRVPQPLQKDTGLNLSVVGDSNTTDADLYVSEVLPRSVFDFTRIVGSGGDRVRGAPALGLDVRPRARGRYGREKIPQALTRHRAPHPRKASCSRTARCPAASGSACMPNRRAPTA